MSEPRPHLCVGGHEQVGTSWWATVGTRRRPWGWHVDHRLPYLPRPFRFRLRFRVTAG